MPRIVNASPTPNINAYKFNLDEAVTEGKGQTYKAENANDHPVAAAIFATGGGIRQVFLLNDFVTVTKEPDADWEEMMEPIAKAIESV